MNASGLRAACEAAARVNAMLQARGKLKQPTPPLLPQASPILPSSNEALFTAKVEINHTPPNARNLLTKSSIRDEFCRGTDVSISTKGRYIPPGEAANFGDRPLFLYIQGSSLAAINRVVDHIYGLIRQQGGTVPGQIPCTQPTPPHHFYQDRVYLGLDFVFPAFHIQLKINGPNESFLNHIRTETGSKVTLRGRGSGNVEHPLGQESPEPLHLHIVNHKPDGLRAAKTLANNLIETVQQDYQQWLRTNHPYISPAPAAVPPPPSTTTSSARHNSGWDSIVRRTPAIQPAPPVYSPRVMAPTQGYDAGVPPPPPPQQVSIISPIPYTAHVPPTSSVGLPMGGVITYPLPPMMVAPPYIAPAFKRKLEEEGPQLFKRPVPAPVPPPTTTVVGTPTLLLSRALPMPASLPSLRTLWEPRTPR